MPSRCRVRSTASTIFFLPILERWDRPTAASLRASGVHPGRLAQGPDEKSGRAGRAFGFVIYPLPYRRAALRWGSVARGPYRETRGGRQCAPMRTPSPVPTGAKRSGGTFFQRASRAIDRGTALV